MHETRIQKTKNKLARIYGAGILVFTVVLGSITVLTLFLAQLNLT